MRGPRLTAFHLTVHDLDHALAFYRDVLGLEVHGEVECEGRRWVTVNPPSQPDMRIVLETPDGVASATDRLTLEELIAKGLAGRLVFATTNCDTTFAHLEAAGIEVIQEPTTNPDNTRDCAFLDPSGNLLRFTQPWPAVPRPPHEGPTDA
ncbi:VOC family protein [Nocardia sp. NPDC050406]|uniref:VOC family protein n=1 Tax=Nocardia sp. NPDC050406 TaxID=3364318 RepID=UPI0037BC41F1